MRYATLVVLILIWSQNLVGEGANVVKKPIINGNRAILTRKFAKIPDYANKPAKIVGITSFGADLYVCTSVSGGRIYKVSNKGQVSLWFDVAKALLRKGRRLDVSNQIEGGVRSIAFHSNYRKNGLFYVSLMERQTKPLSTYKFFSRPPRPVKVHSVVLEWSVNSKSKQPNPASLREVFRIAFPNYFHVIKQLEFRGSFLYITHGDGAPDRAANKGGQGNDGLGKIIRINPLRKGKQPYTVPGSNPFSRNPRFKSEIYALGFHNPHNLCFSRGGQLFVADTGGDNVEEINLVRPGGNYGWPLREGHFVRLQRGGVITGVAPLPKDDAKFNFIYPNAVLGHNGRRGSKLIGQSIAGSCPIENTSPLRGLYLYSNFPTDGALYYSTLASLRGAKTKGPPASLRWATTFKARILYDHDRNPRTKPLALPNLRAVIQTEPGLKNKERVDMRFGRGSRGEIYWSSKQSGWIYLITNSVP